MAQSIATIISSALDIYPDITLFRVESLLYQINPFVSSEYIFQQYKIELDKRTFPNTTATTTATCESESTAITTPTTITTSDETYDNVIKIIQSRYPDTSLKEIRQILRELYPTDTECETFKVPKVSQEYDLYA